MLCERRGDLLNRDDEVMLFAAIELLIKGEIFSLLEKAADEKVAGKKKLMEINNKNLTTSGAFFFELILHGSKREIKHKA